MFTKKIQKIKDIFKKLHGISLQKYSFYIEKKYEKNRSQFVEKIERQIKQKLEKW